MNIEAGHVGLNRTDVKALLALYEVTDPVTVAEHVTLAEQGRKQPWLSTYRDILREEQLLYFRYEAVAARLRAFQPGIHQLLQTTGYARCIIQAVEPDTPAGVTERLVEVLLHRQERLHRPTPPTVQILLDEAALLRPPSTDAHARKVLQAQVQRLHELAELPHLDLRVVPIDAGHHFGIENPFTLVDLPSDAGSVVYREAERATSIIRESVEDTTYHNRLFEHLASSASSLTGW